mgnify:CR=1 FL=1
MALRRWIRSSHPQAQHEEVCPHGAPRRGRSGAIMAPLEYHECIADDVKPGKHTSFPQSVKLKRGEVVWFSWIVYRSRKQR